MTYFSTRGGVCALTFSQAVMMGLAEDGGLLLPRTIPRLDAATLSAWQEKSYADLAYEVMSRFIDDIPASDLRTLVGESYGAFDHVEVAPLAHYGDLHLLELFHGPTLAFKDIALQFLGNLFAYFLKKSGGRMNIIGATSGDTGSAAIYAVRGKERINIFILHPHERVSPVQEKQMTTVLDDNVHNIAIRGSFDDGQTIVKGIFGDLAFKNAHHLAAINSINWARILAQVVYYIRSCLHVRGHEGVNSIDFAVPTGNFGDIFAGFIAKRMLPEGMIRRLVLATNANDILARFVKNGDYSLGKVVQTSSPSMDIQSASNFERYLYYLTDSDPKRTAGLMEEFAGHGRLDLSGYLDQIKRDFAAEAIGEETVKTTIAEFYKEHKYILDPHTAVGVAAALRQQKPGVAMVCLATAHPAKFAAVVEEAIGQLPPVPEALVGILERSSRCEVMDADAVQVKAFIENHDDEP